MMNISCYIDIDICDPNDYIVICDPVNPLVRFSLGDTSHMKYYYNYASVIEPILLAVKNILTSDSQLFLLSLLKSSIYNMYEKLVLYKLKYMEYNGNDAMRIIYNTVWKHVGYPNYARV